MSTKLSARHALLSLTFFALAGARAAEALAIPALASGRLVVVPLLLLATWHASSHVGGSIRTTPRATRYLLTLMWLFAIVALFSTLWSVDLETTVLDTFALLTLVATVHLCITRLWRDAHTMVTDLCVIYWTIASTVIASLLMPVDERTGRLAGLYNNPNGLAMTAGLMVLLGISLFLYTRRKIHLTPLIPLIAVLAMTQSRTTLLALAAACLLLLARSGSKVITPIIWIGALVTTVGILAGVNLPTTRFTADAPGTAGDLGNRLEVWDYGLQLWRQEPLVGFGFHAGPNAFEAGPGAVTTSTTSAHSSYMQVLVDLGLLGLVVFAALAFVAIAVAWHAPSDAFTRTLSTCIVFGLVVGIAESVLTGVGQPFPWVYWLLVGATSICAPTQEGSPIRASSRIS